MIDELPRLYSQHGLFTQLDSDAYLDLEGALAADEQARRLLVKYEFSRKAAEEGLVDLGHHGINYRSLFPDLEGAARETNARLESALRTVAASAALDIET
jgi:hypothetical protein